MKYCNLEIMPTLFEVLCSMSMIWWSNFKLSSIVTTRYLVMVCWGISELLTWSSTVGVGWLVLGEMISILDFVGLVVNLFAFNHLVSFERSIFIFDFNEGSFGPSTSKQVS